MYTSKPEARQRNKTASCQAPVAHGVSAHSTGLQPSVQENTTAVQSAAFTSSSATSGALSAPVLPSTLYQKVDVLLNGQPQTLLMPVTMVRTQPVTVAITTPMASPTLPSNVRQIMPSGSTTLPNGTTDMSNGNLTTLSGTPTLSNGNPTWLNVTSTLSTTTTPNGSPILTSGNPILLNGTPTFPNGNQAFLNRTPNMPNGVPTPALTPTNVAVVKPMSPKQTEQIILPKPPGSATEIPNVTVPRSKPPRGWHRRQKVAFSPKKKYSLGGIRHPIKPKQEDTFSPSKISVPHAGRGKGRPRKTREETPDMGQQIVDLPHGVLRPQDITHTEVNRQKDMIMMNNDQNSLTTSTSFDETRKLNARSQTPPRSTSVKRRRRKSKYPQKVIAPKSPRHNELQSLGIENNDLSPPAKLERQSSQNDDEVPFLKIDSVFSLSAAGIENDITPELLAHIPQEKPDSKLKKEENVKRVLGPSENRINGTGKPHTATAIPATGPRTAQPLETIVLSQREVDLLITDQVELKENVRVNESSPDLETKGESKTEPPGQLGGNEEIMSDMMDSDQKSLGDSSTKSHVPEAHSEEDKLKPSSPKTSENERDTDESNNKLPPLVKNGGILDNETIPHESVAHSQPGKSDVSEDAQRTSEMELETSGVCADIVDDQNIVNEVASKVCGQDKTFKTIDQDGCVSLNEGKPLECLLSTEENVEGTTPSSEGKTPSSEGKTPSSETSTEDKTEKVVPVSSIDEGKHSGSLQTTEENDKERVPNGETCEDVDQTQFPKEKSARSLFSVLSDLAVTGVSENSEHAVHDSSDHEELVRAFPSIMNPAKPMPESRNDEEAVEKASAETVCTGTKANHDGERSESPSQNANDALLKMAEKLLSKSSLEGLRSRPGTPKRVVKETCLEQGVEDSLVDSKHEKKHTEHSEGHEVMDIEMTEVKSDPTLEKSTVVQADKKADKEEKEAVGQSGEGTDVTCKAVANGTKLKENDSALGSVEGSHSAKKDPVLETQDKVHSGEDGNANDSSTERKDQIEGDETSDTECESAISPEDYEILQRAFSSFVPLEDIGHLLDGARSVNVHEEPWSKKFGFSDLGSLALDENSFEDNRKNDIREWIEKIEKTEDPYEFESSELPTPSTSATEEVVAPEESVSQAKTEPVPTENENKIPKAKKKPHQTEETRLKNIIRAREWRRKKKLEMLGVITPKGQGAGNAEAVSKKPDAEERRLKRIMRCREWRRKKKLEKLGLINSTGQVLGDADAGSKTVEGVEKPNVENAHSEFGHVELSKASKRFRSAKDKEKLGMVKPNVQVPGDAEAVLKKVEVGDKTKFENSQSASRKVELVRASKRVRSVIDKDKVVLSARQETELSSESAPELYPIVAGIVGPVKTSQTEVASGSVRSCPLRKRKKRRGKRSANAIANINKVNSKRRRDLLKMMSQQESAESSLEMPVLEPIQEVKLEHQAKGTKPCPTASLKSADLSSHTAMGSVGESHSLEIRDRVSRGKKIRKVPRGKVAKRRRKLSLDAQLRKNALLARERRRLKLQNFDSDDTIIVETEKPRVGEFQQKDSPLCDGELNSTTANVVEAEKLSGNQIASGGIRRRGMKRKRASLSGLNGNELPDSPGMNEVQMRRKLPKRIKLDNSTPRPSATVSRPSETKMLPCLSPIPVASSSSVPVVAEDIQPNVPRRSRGRPRQNSSVKVPANAASALNTEIHVPGVEVKAEPKDSTSAVAVKPNFAEETAEKEVCVRRKRGRPPKVHPGVPKPASKGAESATKNDHDIISENQTVPCETAPEEESELSLWGDGADLRVDTSFEEDAFDHHETFNESDDFYLSMSFGNEQLSPVAKRPVSRRNSNPKPKKVRRLAKRKSVDSNASTPPTNPSEDHLYNLQVLREKLKSQNEELERLRAQQST